MRKHYRFSLCLWDISSRPGNEAALAVLVVPGDIRTRGEECDRSDGSVSLCCSDAVAVILHGYSRKLARLFPQIRSQKRQNTLWRISPSQE